jgi:hypothetical protein
MDATPPPAFIMEQIVNGFAAKFPEATMEEADMGRRGDTETERERGLGLGKRRECGYAKSLMRDDDQNEEALSCLHGETCAVAYCKARGDLGLFIFVFTDYYYEKKSSGEKISGVSMYIMPPLWLTCAATGKLFEAMGTRWRRRRVDMTEVTKPDW